MATARGDRKERAEDAAVILRRLLDALERGELDAPGSHGARLLRRMEGAAVALEAAAAHRGLRTHGTA